MKLLLATRSDGVRLVTLAGRLDAAVAPQLQASLAEALGDGTRLLLDLGAVAFVDSSGLGVLVHTLKAARQAGGDLRLANASPPVQRLLRLTALDRVFRALPSSDAPWA